MKTVYLNNYFKVVLLFCCICVFSVLLNAQQVQPIITFKGTFQNGQNTHKYFITRDNVSISQARTLASKINSHLTTINNSSENAFVSSFTSSFLWIGLSDEIQEGSYQWDNGEPFSYSSWGTSQEPNNLNNEDYCQINQHRPGGWNDVNASTSVKAVIEVPVASLKITKPDNLAYTNLSNTSGWLALEGEGIANRPIKITVYNRLLDVFSISQGDSVDSEGKWDSLVYVSRNGAFIRVEYQDEPLVGDILQVNMPDTNPPVEASPTTVYWLLKKGDIILSSGGSEQSYIYGAKYSHVGIYVGSDDYGTPLIAEAVLPNDSNGLGQVRSAPIHLSTIWTHGKVNDIFRPVSNLSNSQKDLITQYARRMTDGRASYWDLGTILTNGILSKKGTETFSLRRCKNWGDFTWLCDAWWAFDSTMGVPFPDREQVFNDALATASANKEREDKFICSTLVYQSYKRVGLDLSSPNSAGEGTIINNVMFVNPDRFLQYVRPRFVFPDTIAENPNLFKVNN